MDIKILDSWLREHLETTAKPNDIARALSLTSASIEKIEEFKGDFIYNIEVTTNRVDMMSVSGIAREAVAVLPQFGFPAHVIARKNDEAISSRLPRSARNDNIHIQNDDKLVKRICCVVLEVTQKESPQYVKDRLEASGIRSLNNLIDVTNYVMMEVGHPTHAFDYDRLITKKLIIRAAKKGEKIVTLDKKEHILTGGDIVADNGNGEIVDLLGIMGTLNSVITDATKRVLFFLDNNDPVQIRKTSMGLGIRTEAAGINEKDVDPELMMRALLRGIELYKEIADAKVVSDIIDIYPHPWQPKTITVSEAKIQQVIGVPISLGESKMMLERLEFHVSLSSGRGTKGEGKEDSLVVTIPSYRDADMHSAEDVIEEIARMYGYHNLPSRLPASSAIIPHHYTSEFFWEKRIKESLKYWGFTEVYTYSMVSKQLFEGKLEQTVTLKNPLDEDHVYMRQTLIPSLLEVINENKKQETIRIFELANVYHKTKTLPQEIRMLSGIVKGKKENFFTVKGIIEQIITDLGIKNMEFKDRATTTIGATIFIRHPELPPTGGSGSKSKQIGEISVLEDGLISFELNFALLTQHASLKKVYTPLAKYPPVIEDISMNVDLSIKTGDIVEEIKKQSNLVVSVSLLDQYEDKRTFHILYQDKEKNLTNGEVAKIREKITVALQKKFSAKIN